MTIKNKLGSSTAWMSLAAGSNSIVSFFIFIFLSRILAPEDIGLVAFALIVVDLGKILVNAGFTQAVVQHSKWDDVYASTCFYMNMIFATLVAVAVIFIGAPLIARYYASAAEPVIKTLSVIYFIEGLKAVHEGKLKREFSFRMIALRSISGSMVSGVVGIYLALHGYGVWSLVWQQITNQILVSLITIVSAKWMPLFRFSFAQAKLISKFSFPLMFAQLVANFGSNIFEVLIGFFIGPAALGFYRVGGRSVYILQDIVLKPFENTALSALARVSGLTMQAQGAIRMMRVSSFLIFPIFFGIAAISTSFIVLAFGQKWEASGDIMTILAIAVVPMLIWSNVDAALAASGNSRLVMAIASSGFVINCLLGLLVIPMGLTAAACGFLLRNYVLALFYLFFFKRIFGVAMSKMLKTFLPAFAAAFLMFCITTAAKHLIADSLPALLNIAVLFAIGVVSYVVLMCLVFRNETRSFLNEIVSMLPQRMAKPVRFIITILNFK